MKILLNQLKIVNFQLHKTTEKGTDPQPNKEPNPIRRFINLAVNCHKKNPAQAMIKNLS